MIAANGSIPGVIVWGGLPVPYVAAWSSEQGWSTREDPFAGNRYCLYARDGRRGMGKPIFGKMDPARVRRVVFEQRCQVCFRRLPMGVGYVADVVLGRHGEYPIVNEPLACRTCFAVAVLRCPGIARQQERPRFLAAVVQRYQPLLVEMQAAPDGDETLNRVIDGRRSRGSKVYGYARPALQVYETFDLNALRGVPAEVPDA